MYVMEKLTKWEDYFHLVDFSYNQRYQAFTKMSPFETLYGWKCHTPLIWSQQEDRLILGLDILQEMEH